MQGKGVKPGEGRREMGRGENLFPSPNESVYTRKVMLFLANNRAKPPSFWSIFSRRSFVNTSHAKDLTAMSNFFGRRVKILLVILGLGAGIGILYSIHRDAGIGAAIIATYGGLYYLYRKIGNPKQKDHYPIVRYRGYLVRKKKFFL